LQTGGTWQLKKDRQGKADKDGERDADEDGSKGSGQHEPGVVPGRAEGIEEPVPVDEPDRRDQQQTSQGGLGSKERQGASRSKNQGDGSDRQHAGETGEGPSLVVNGRALQGAGPRQALQETAGQIGQGLGQTLAVVVEALPGFVGERLGAGQDCLNLAAREWMARMPPKQL